MTHDRLMNVLAVQQRWWRFTTGDLLKKEGARDATPVRERW